jgi:Bardet-Biedl syndrome 1 protein
MTEECALVATLEGGGLDIRFLSRRAKVGSPTKGGGLSGAFAAAEPPPLAVPKKSKLYVEFAKRERENAQDMYHALQQCALCSLPLITAGR